MSDHNVDKAFELRLPDPLIEELPFETGDLSGIELLEAIIRERVKFQHYKTKTVYCLVGLTLRENPCALAVLYQPVEKPMRVPWDRPAHEFFEYVEEPDTGILVPRFQPVW